MTGCNDSPHIENSLNSESALTHLDFEGKRIGVISGMVTSAITKDDINGTAVFYTSTEAGIRDLHNRRIEGFMIDLSIARFIANQPGNENLQVIVIPPEIYTGPLGAISNDPEMIERFNIFLAKIEADGTLTDMQNRWLKDDPDPIMPSFSLSDQNVVIKVATGDESQPFSYRDENGDLKGYSNELAMRFAQHEGVDIEFIITKFQDLIPSAADGDVDIGFDAITITEARKERIHFTDPFYEDLMGIIALR